MKELPNFVWNGEDLDITVMFWQSVFKQMKGNVTVAPCGQGLMNYMLTRDIATYHVTQK